MAAKKLHQETLSFLASQPTPEQIMNLRPSPEMSARLKYLLKRERDGDITSSELEELNEFERIEHLVVMSKIEALNKLTDKE